MESTLAITAGKPALLADDEALVVVDVGRATIRVGVVTTDRSDEMERFQNAILGKDPVAMLATLVRRAVPPGARLMGAVVGLPASFDAAGRRTLFSPRLPALEGLCLGEELGAVLGVPVVVEQDTVLLAVGEWAAGAGARAESLLCVFIGAGIGGAMLFHGQPYHGASGSGVAVGHLPIRDHGRRCVCGNTGCLDAYASGRVLVEIAEAAGTTLENVFSHPEAQADIVDYLAALADGIVAAVSILDPKVLVLGGGIHGQPGFPRDALALRIVRGLRTPVLRADMEIRSAALGVDAALHAAPILFARAMADDAPGFGTTH